MRTRDIAVVIGGALVKKDGRWQTPNFDGSDNFSVCGSRLRVIAACFLYEENPELRIITSGGKGQLKDVLPGKMTLASVLKDELTALGIPAKNIIKEPKSGNTYQQLKELQRLLKGKKFRSVALISNRYQLPRIEAMIHYVDELAALKKMSAASKLKTLSAEEIVLRHDPESWRKFIAAAYRRKDVKAGVLMNRRGAAQVRKGTYQLR